MFTQIPSTNPGSAPQARAFFSNHLTLVPDEDPKADTTADRRRAGVDAIIRANLRPPRVTIPPRPRSNLAALKAMADEIAAVRTEQPLPLDVDIADTVDRVLRVTGRIQALVPAMQLLPGFDITPVCNLRWYAAAALQAHESAGRIDEDAAVLTRVSIKLRDDLMAGAVLMASFGKIDPRRLAGIRNRNDADLSHDLTELVHLYEDNWDRIAGRTDVHRGMLTRAFVNASRLRDQRVVTRGGMTAKSARTRRQAFILLVRVYEHCRRGVSAVRWDYGDEHVIAPALGIPRHRLGRYFMEVVAEGAEQSR